VINDKITSAAAAVTRLYRAGLIQQWAAATRMPVASALLQREQHCAPLDL
jgi:hypothetical protein